MGHAWLLGLALAKIVAAFLVVFVYLPRRIFPPRPGASPMERFFENLCLMACVSVLVAHGLAVLRIHGLPSLLVSYGLLYLGIRWYRERGALGGALRQSLLSLNVFVLRAVDGLEDLPGLAGARAARWRRRWQGRRMRGPAVVHAVLFASILGLAAWLRLADVVRDASLSFSDSYYHLEALKRLEAGEPYWRDIYPKGFHAFMSVLHLTTWLDPVLVVKLTGPLVGVLIVLSTYYAAFRLTRSRNAALAAMLVVGVVDGNSSLLFEHLGSDAWQQFFGATTAAPFKENFRQTGALSQEFALVFLLPALLFAHAYWAGRAAGRDLALSVMCAVLILMTHWIVAVALAVGLGLVGLLSLLRPGLSLATVRRGVAAYLVAAVVGNAQLVTYLAESTLAHAGTARVDYAHALPERYASWLDVWSERLPVPPVLYLAAGVAVLVGLHGLLGVRGARRRIQWGWMALFILALVFGARALNFGVRYVVPPDRAAQFLGIVLAVALGAGWGIVSRLAGERRRASRSVLVSQGLTAVVLAVVLIVAMPSGFGAAPRYEYASLAELYYRISREHPPLSWTIVSNVEDYSKVLARGWHLNATELLDRFDPFDQAVRAPTPFVFIFVEKTPLAAVTTYQDAHARRDEQRRLGEWVVARSSRFDDLSLYHEDEATLVYLWRAP
jgi:hypothetical protein